MEVESKCLTNYLNKIYHNVHIQNNVTYKSHKSQPKHIFAKLFIEFSYLKDFQHNPQIINVIILFFGIKQFIIHENNYKHMKVLLKHLINNIHKDLQSISKTKRHIQKHNMTILGYKSHFQNVFLFHPQLVVA